MILGGVTTQVRQDAATDNSSVVSIRHMQSRYLILEKNVLNAWFGRIKKGEGSMVQMYMVQKVHDGSVQVL